MTRNNTVCHTTSAHSAGKEQSTLNQIIHDNVPMVKTRFQITPDQGD